MLLGVLVLCTEHGIGVPQSVVLGHDLVVTLFECLNTIDQIAMSNLVARRLLDLES